MKYVLVAEDDPDIATLLCQAIGDHLYVATHIVPNGALVPDAIAARRPDLVVLDVALPGLSGLDVFDIVRSDPTYEGVPILFLTATPEKAEQAHARTGLHHVMSKPFDTDELIAIVDAMIDGAPASLVASAPAAA